MKSVLAIFLVRGVSGFDYSDLWNSSNSAIRTSIISLLMFVGFSMFGESFVAEVDLVPGKFCFSIPAGNGEHTLKEAALYAGVEILFDQDALSSIQTSAVQGEYTATEALMVMLMGTPCEVVPVSEGETYAIVYKKDVTGDSDLLPETNPKERSNNQEMFIQKESEKGLFKKIGLAILSVLAAQNSVSAQEQDLNDEDIYVLSPFEITAQDEDGYLATSSLAGSRINTNLADIGSAVSVYTEELMEDLSATDSESLLSYGLNTEVGGSRGNFINPTSEGIENNNLDEPHLNTRVRGLTSADNTMNYYRTDVPWDGYFVRRVDIQRGANSVLFGLGSPAGIINATTNNAEFSDFGKVALRYDKYGSVRGNLDINREIIKGELAIRIALLAEDKKFQQEPAFDDRDRLFISSSWAPSLLNTGRNSFKIRASFETGDVESNRPRSVVPIDRITPWLMPENESGLQGEYASMGNYGFNQTPYNQFDDYLTGTGQENSNPWRAATWGSSPVLEMDNGNINRIIENSSNDRGSWYYTTQMLEAGDMFAILNDGSASSSGRDIQGHINHPGQVRIAGLQNASSGLELPHQGFWRDRSFTDNQYFDFYKNLIDGDTKREFKSWDVWELDVTHSFLDNKIGYNFGAFHQSYETEFYAALGNVFAPGISVDVGMWDRTSQPGALTENPHLGDALVTDSNGSGRTRQSERDSVRFQAFFKHDFTKKDDSILRKILGSHDLVGVLQNRQLDQKSDNFQLLGMGPEYLFERGTAVATDSTPPMNSRFAEFGRDIGSIAPFPQFYLDSNSDYSGIGRVQGSLSSMPQGSYDIIGYNATPLPGFDAVTATQVWTDSPFTGDNQSDSVNYQSQNPEYYRGWESVGNYYIANAYLNEQDREYLTTSKNYFTEDVDSIAAVWTGRWLNGGIVGMMGWRRDEVTETWYEHDFRDDGPTIDVENNKDTRSTEVESRNWSLKANLTYLTGLSGKLPFDVHVLYAEGEVQTPDPTRVDVFGRTLPNSKGNTEDLSMMLTAANGRWSFRVTKYETVVKDAVSTASVNNQKYRLEQVLSTGSYAAGLIETDAALYTADWLPLSSAAEAAGFETEAEFRRNVMAPAWRSFEAELFERYPLTQGWYLTQFQPGDQIAPQVRFPDFATLVEDTISEGWEFEFVGNPTKNWNVAVNLSKTKAIRDNLPGDEFEQVIDFITTSLDGPAGGIPIWWFSGPAVGVHLEPWLGELTKAKALNGAAQPEIREWKGNIVTNYNFTEGTLAGFGIGAGYRYEDSQIYGYELDLDEEGNTIVDLDRAYQDDARHTFDLWATYTHKVTDSVDWRIQLNVFNAFGENELVPLQRNPDGSTGMMGIREGVSWALTNTFSF